MLRALTGKAAGSAANELEYLLQKVLMVLASMHRRAASGRSPLQLSESAAVIFDALRVVDACEVGFGKRLRYCFTSPPLTIRHHVVAFAPACSAECLDCIEGDCFLPESEAAGQSLCHLCLGLI